MPSHPNSTPEPTTSRLAQATAEPAAPGAVGDYTITCAEAFRALQAMGHQLNDVEHVLDEFVCQLITSARNSFGDTVARSIGKSGVDRDTVTLLSPHELWILDERLKYSADETHNIPAWATYPEESAASEA